MKPSRLLLRLSGGAVTNVDFSDAQLLLEALGFEEVRVTGSHHVYVRLDVPELVNLQNRRGQAKPYQLRQLISLVKRYNMTIEENE